MTLAAALLAAMFPATLRGSAMPKRRLAQVLIAAGSAAFRLGRVIASTSLDDIELALFVAGPMLALAAVGALLYRRSRAARTDTLLLALTAILSAFSSLVFFGVSPNESGSSIVYLVIPAYEYLGLLALLAISVLVRWTAGR